ncbi:MAG TPA: type 1 glutamine amidotransferase domain-containing protein [Methanoregulaceae archaeon]|nr:type 1 glutamine amidotransferase domain-containing protein [Methanoregulaceae archaeon]
MKRIAVMVTDMFEDVEYAEPVRAFLDNGHKVICVGLEEGALVTGKSLHSTITIDRAVRDVTIDEFDALFIPGGYSPDALRVDPDAVLFVKNFVESKKPVLGICHAAQLLISARVLEGRKITGYISIVQDIKNAGAEYVDSEVVRDNNLLFSRNPKDLPAFIRASLELLDT